MIKRLYPKLYLNSIFELDLEVLKAKGVRGIVFDIDNTLVPYDVVHPTQEIIDFFKTIKEEGFQICLASNNTEDRVITFNQHLKVFAIHKAGKPRRGGLRKAMALMNLESHEVAMVGDQIFTDVFVGNRAGAMSVLVVPVSDKDEWITKIKRGIEKKVVRSYEKYQQKHHNG
ncbi:MAG: YqeG family HAD IIIA-type phosphatase [Cellulosilyticaceae bacterium]